MRKKNISGVKHVVVVSSGKGGVGKSTVSANLAAMLAYKGYKTALLDADIYGPSVPRIFGVENERVGVYQKEGQEYMLPVEKYGVKLISIGMLVDPNQAVIWRGPLAANALSMMFNNTEWGDIDYLVVDFPPGTGDIQISTLQQYRVSAAIVVTTPQMIAVNDARKGADMFRKMDVPLLGIVENMSWFTPKEHPEEKYFIFGEGGGQTLSQEFDVELLARIPMLKGMGDSSEAGDNLKENLLGPNDVFWYFENLAARVTSQLDDEEIPECDGGDDDECDGCSHDCDHNCEECSHRH